MFLPSCLVIFATFGCKGTTFLRDMQVFKEEKFKIIQNDSKIAKDNKKHSP